MTGPTPSFESVSIAAVLAQRGREDKAELLEDLVTMLSAIVPGVQIERALLRRHVTGIRLPLGGFVYTLKRTSGKSFDAARQQEVRGVVIRTDPMEIDAPAIEVELRRTERGRDALRDWLNSTNP